MISFSRHSSYVEYVANHRTYSLYDAKIGHVDEGRTVGLAKRLALIVISLGGLAVILYWAFVPNAFDLDRYARLQNIAAGPASHKADRLAWPPRLSYSDRLALFERFKQNPTPRKSDRRLWPPVLYGRNEQRQMTGLIKRLSPPSYYPRFLEPSIVAPKTRLVALRSSPFPYRGMMPSNNKPFLNIRDGDQPGHKTAFGRSYWLDKTYNDPRALLHIPKRFDVRAPGIMVVFFHGHGAMLERDILNRQRVPAQISQSGVNAVLVAPQFAVNAKDSSAGKFWKPGALRRFLNEASEKLAIMQGDPKSARIFKNMPVVIVAYSGGYVPAAYSVASGGIESRLRGVVLLDGLYGHLDKFATWIKQARSAFFVSAYAGSTRRKNEKLKSVLRQENIAYTTKLAPELRTGSVTFLSTNAKHRDFVTQAWADNPISDLLGRLGRITSPHQWRVSSIDH